MNGMPMELDYTKLSPEETERRKLGFASVAEKEGIVTYRAGRDISRLTEMVQHTGFPFEARALGSPTRDSPATRAAGIPPLPFSLVALQRVSSLLFDFLLFNIHVLVS